MSNNRVARKILKKMGLLEPRQQYTKFDEATRGYITLHPTKGWQRVSGSRIRAQELMMQRFGFVK